VDASALRALASAPPTPVVASSSVSAEEEEEDLGARSGTDAREETRAPRRAEDALAVAGGDARAGATPAVRTGMLTVWVGRARARCVGRGTPPYVCVKSRLIPVDVDGGGDLAARPRSMRLDAVCESEIIRFTGASSKASRFFETEACG
jgi:hypothetical protein